MRELDDTASLTPVSTCIHLFIVFALTLDLGRPSRDTMLYPMREQYLGTAISLQEEAKGQIM